MKYIQPRLLSMTFALLSFLLMQSALTAEAQDHQLNVTAKPAIAGSFNQHAATLAAGESIHLYAYANSSFTFVNWVDEKGTVISEQMDFTYTMPERDVQLTATYEYNPANPGNPATNYWNKELGEVIVDDFKPGQLQTAVMNAIGNSNTTDVAMITVAGVMNSNDFGIVNNCTNCSLLDLSRVSGITQVPSYAFDCTNLESVYLPATIEKIGYRAFYECKQLSSLIIYAMMPPALENNVFTNVPDGLVVYVPASAITQYQETAGWKDFTILPIQEDIRSISVSLPEGSNASDYAQMWLELTNTKSGQRMHYVMTSRTLYSFANIIRNTSWNVTLRNERGDVFGQIDNVEVKDEDVSVTFASLSKPQTVTLSVVTPDGQDVTGQTQVTWTDASGNYLSQGVSLAGLPIGCQASYSMVLSQDLALAYETPLLTDYVVTDGNNNVTCRLTAIPQVQISGKVKDVATGLPLSGATVSASQTFGGKYSKTVNAKTDGNGTFTLAVAKVPTSIAFAASDYISQTRDMLESELGEVNELEDVQLKSIAGATISVEFAYTTVEGETQNWYSDYQNVNYTLYNIKKQRAISQFNVQYPQIVLLEEVDDGDELRLTVTSRTNAFNPVDATATIADQKASVTIGIVELGKIQASFASTGNASVVGSLYDAAGKLIKTYDYSGASLIISDLADGQYTLVSMGSSRLFNTIYDLSQLPQTGLAEGTDYVQNVVEVKSGQISAISINEVPTLDESKLYYTGDNTSFTVNKPSIVAGNYLTLTGRIDFKPAYATSVSNVQMVVDLPENCSFIEYSVMVGNSISAYTLDGNQLTIPMPRYTDRVRFCVIPTAGGEYAPSAFVQFDLDGETVTQPIGSANYIAKDLTISVPSTVAKTSIPISGTAIGTSNIEIYDNGVLIGQTTSLANGTWATTCELNEPYNLSTHNIYTKVTTKQGIGLQSESKAVTYDMNAVQVSKVTMYHYNPEMRKTFESVFDFQNPSSKPNQWTVYYPKKLFTYTVDFTNNSPEKVSNVVLYVHSADGQIVKLYPKYDEKKDIWTADLDMGSSPGAYYPVNVSVDYYSSIEKKADRNRVNTIIEGCNKIIEPDITIQTLSNKISSTEDIEESSTLFQSLYSHLGIQESESNSTDINIKVFLDGIEWSNEESNFSAGVLNLEDEDGNDYEMKCLPLSDSGIQDEEFSTFISIPLTDDTFIQIRVEEGKIEIVDVKNNLYYSYFSNLNVYNLARTTRSSVKDEFFTKLSQYRTTANAIRENFNHNPLFKGVREFFNRGLIKKLADLKTCQDIRHAYCSNKLSLEQLEQLDLHKLVETETRLAKEVGNIQEALNVLGALFKVLNAAAILNDIGIAWDSLTEWDEIISNIEKLDCPGMDELANKAKGYKKKVAIGYLANIGSNIAVLCGVDKMLASAVVAQMGVAAEAGAAVAAQAVAAIGLLINDITLLQGGYTQKMDIEWKWDIRSKIPGLKCNPDPDLNLGNTGGGGHISGSPDDDVQIDPSGYVYEGVSSNRVEGATATVFYKEQEEDMYGDLHENVVKWDASEYAQENPLFTDENGYYRWDVPQGLWQVKFEKEGYETAYSEWLPVPPPQLDINIEMRQSKQPEVKAARAFEDAVEVEFDKYMMPELLTTENISVMQNGIPVEGCIELLNSEAATEGSEETFASKVRFNAAQPFTEQEITLTVNNRVKSYAGIRMQDSYQQSFTIEQEIRQIACESQMAVDYGKNARFTVSVLPASASRGKVLTVKTSSPMILGVETEQVVIDNDGKAEITISGELPGTAALTFSVEGSDKTATTIANIEMSAGSVTTPTADIASGTLLNIGSKIELSSETDGATIYYTTDGSCPCDEATRLEYSEPIVITRGVVIKAIAVKNGMDDSEVAEFTYGLIGDANGDGVVDVADVVAVVNKILNKASGNFNEAAANVNGDEGIDVADVVGIVNIILGKRTSARGEKTDVVMTDNDRVSLCNLEDGSLSLCLENEGSYVAAQFDIRLSDGQQLEGISLNNGRADGHCLTYS